MKQTVAFLLSAAVLAAANPLAESVLPRDTPDLSGYRRLIFGADIGRCLTYQGGSVSNGVELSFFNCTLSDNNPHGITVERKSLAWEVQNSLVTEVSQTVTTYFNGPNGEKMCLDAGSYPIENGTPVHMWQCYDGLPQQQWKFTAYGQMSLADGSKCLDLTLGTTNRIQTWDCSQDDGQQIFGTNDFPAGIFECEAGQPCDSS